MSYRQVINGTRARTSGGLHRKDIAVRRLSGGKRVRFVSRRRSLSGKSNLWIASARRAKRALGIPKNTFVLVKKSGTEMQRALYLKAKEIYKTLAKK